MELDDVINLGNDLFRHGAPRVEVVSGKEPGTVVVTVKPAELPPEIARERDRLMSKLAEGLRERMDALVGKRIDRTDPVSERRRAALHAIFEMVSEPGADWQLPEQVVTAVRLALAAKGNVRFVTVCGDDPTNPLDDVMMPAWLHNRMTGMAAAITAILDMADPDGEGTWSLDDPEAVVRLVRERMVRREPCATCHGATCLHDHGCAHGHQANDVPAATEARRAVYVTRDPVHAFDGRPLERLMDQAVERMLDLRAVAVSATVHAIAREMGWTPEHAASRLHMERHGLAEHYKLDGDLLLLTVEVCTEEAGRMPVLKCKVVSPYAAVVQDAIDKSREHVQDFRRVEMVGGLPTPVGPVITRPGCYADEATSTAQCHRSLEPNGGNGCEGCAARNTAGERRYIPDPFEMVSDPTIPPDQVVMRSHTVDGMLLDEVRAVNVGTDPSGTDPFAGVADDEPAALSPRAQVVITSLGTKAREVVCFLADRDPQTSLRILGAVFGGDDLDGQAGAESRVPIEQLTNLELVQCVDRLPHDAGKPLMDRWTLTALGREVARILARG